MARLGDDGQTVCVSFGSMHGVCKSVGVDVCLGELSITIHQHIIVSICAHTHVRVHTHTGVHVGAEESGKATPSTS